MRKIIILNAFCLFSIISIGQNKEKNVNNQEIIIEKYLKNGAWNHHLNPTISDIINVINSEYNYALELIKK